jgi:Skp family chaperone for outer membrane proteins
MLKLPKVKSSLIFMVLATIFFILSILLSRQVNLQRAERDKEMAARIDLEEKLNKAAKEKTTLEEKLKSTEAKLEEEKISHGTTKKILSQEQLINQSLKEELVKVTKLRETLEEKLREASLSGKIKSGAK